MKGGRLLIIGIDGGTFRLMRPLMERGELPNLARISREGVERDLMSTVPAITPAAWTSSVTGMRPGNHNIFDFFTHTCGDYRMDSVTINSTHRQAAAFWEILSELGYRLNIVNVPFTFPPDAINGNMVSGANGMPGRDSGFAHPPGLKNEILERFPDFPPGIDGQAIYFQDDAKVLEQTLSSIRLTADVLCYLEDRDPADVSMVVFDDIDRLQHFLWRHIDPAHPQHDPDLAVRFGGAIDEAYREIDRAVGEIVRRYHKDSAVMVYSDHGFGPMYKNVHINDLLMRHGLLFTKKRPPHLALLTRVGLTKDRIKKWLRGLGLLGILRLVPQEAKLGFNTEGLTHRDIDWTRTKAFYSSFEARAVGLNLKGRFPQGIVEPSEAEALLGRVKELLEGLTDPETGRPVIKKVHGKEVFEGRFQANAPEMVVVFESGYKGVKEMTGGRLFSSAGKGVCATHEEDGIFLACGRGVKASAGVLPPMSIVDVTPVILRILGEPAGEGMDGMAPDDMLAGAEGSGESRAYSARDVLQEELAEDDNTAVAEKLRSMGYMG